METQPTPRLPYDASQSMNNWLATFIVEEVHPLLSWRRSASKTVPPLTNRSTGARYTDADVHATFTSKKGGPYVLHIIDVQNKPDPTSYRNAILSDDYVSIAVSITPGALQALPVPQLNQLSPGAIIELHEFELIFTCYGGVDSAVKLIVEKFSVTGKSSIPNKPPWAATLPKIVEFIRELDRLCEIEMAPPNGVGESQFATQFVHNTASLRGPEPPLQDGQITPVIKQELPDFDWGGTVSTNLTNGPSESLLTFNVQSGMLVGDSALNLETTLGATKDNPVHLDELESVPSALNAPESVVTAEPDAALSTVVSTKGPAVEKSDPWSSFARITRTLTVIPKDQEELLEKRTSWFPQHPGVSFPVLNVPTLWYERYRASAMPKNADTPKVAEAINVNNTDSDSDSSEALGEDEWPLSPTLRAHDDALPSGTDLPPDSSPVRDLGHAGNMRHKEHQKRPLAESADVQQRLQKRQDLQEEDSEMEMEMDVPRALETAVETNVNIDVVVEVEDTPQVRLAKRLQSSTSTTSVPQSSLEYTGQSAKHSAPTSFQPPGISPMSAEKTFISRDPVQSAMDAAVATQVQHRNEVHELFQTQSFGTNLPATNSSPLRSSSSYRAAFASSALSTSALPSSGLSAIHARRRSLSSAPTGSHELSTAEHMHAASQPEAVGFSNRASLNAELRAMGQDNSFPAHQTPNGGSEQGPNAQTPTASGAGIMNREPSISPGFVPSPSLPGPRRHSIESQHSLPESPHAFSNASGARTPIQQQSPFLRQPSAVSSHKSLARVLEYQSPGFTQGSQPQSAQPSPTVFQHRSASPMQVDPTSFQQASPISVSSRGHAWALVPTSAQAPSLEEIYLEFSVVYPEYHGNIGHFKNICVEASSASEFRPHPSLWDDYVIRHDKDYLPYVIDLVRNGQEPVPYSEYYYGTITPRYTTRVLTLEAMRAIVSPEASRTPSVSTTTDVSGVLARSHAPRRKAFDTPQRLPAKKQRTIEAANGMAGASLTNVTNGKVLSAVDSALVTDQEMSPTPDIEADIEKAKVSEKPTNGNVNPAVAPRNPDAPTSKATARQTLIKPASSKPPRPGTIVKTTKPQATKPEVPAKPASSFNSNGGFVVPPKPVRKSFPSNLDGTGEKVKKRSSSKLSRQSLPGSSSTPSSTAESTSKPTKKPASKITKGSTLAPGTSSQGRSKNPYHGKRF